MVKTLVTIDHVVDAQDKYLTQYSKSTQFIDFVDSFIEPINLLETEITLFKTILPLSKAKGANLNLWGEILDSTRRPTDDEDFRALLYALLGAYYSQGSAANIRDLVLSVLEADSTIIDDNGLGTFSFTVLNPAFNFDQSLVSEIIELAKPAGVEFLGFAIANRFGTPAFSFDSDLRPNSEGFGVAVPTKSALTNWTNYIFPPAASITETRRIYHEIDATTGETSITIVTDTADTAWRADIATDYEGNIGAFIGWLGVGASDFYHIETLTDTGTVETTTVGDSTYTKLILIDSDGVDLVEMRKNNQVVLADKLTASEISDLEYDDSDSAPTLAKTLQDDPFDPANYGIDGGGRYAIFIT